MLLFARSLAVSPRVLASVLAPLLVTSCEATLREDHRSSGGPSVEAFAGGAGPGSTSAGGDGQSGGDGGSQGDGGGQGDGGQGGGATSPSCPGLDRLCDSIITYPVGPETSVELRGNFAPGGWLKGIQMTKGPSLWTASVSAPWGIDVQYKFVIDDSTWVPDPSNPNKVPDGYGGLNSVLKAPFCAPFACAPKPAKRFAIIGDYGVDVLSAGGKANETKVAALVKSWSPDLIFTLGDNNYPLGAATTIDQNIGQYFHEYIYPYVGSYGPGGVENRFFPVLGNHDWLSGTATPYTDYFTLPGNERYWEWAAGAVRFFGVDSDPMELDGTSADSVQAKWLQQALAAASEPFRVVLMHHPPHSSGAHGSAPWMQWPFAAWGATVVMAGHEHSYERLSIGGVSYIVNGIGGAVSYSFNVPLPGSEIRFTGVIGALLAEVPDGGNRMRMRVITTGGLLVDDVAFTL